jgi:hypothetical protein
VKEEENASPAVEACHCSFFTPAPLSGRARLAPVCRSCMALMQLFTDVQSLPSTHARITRRPPRSFRSSFLPASCSFGMMIWKGREVVWYFASTNVLLVRRWSQSQSGRHFFQFRHSPFAIRGIRDFGIWSRLSTAEADGQKSPLVQCDGRVSPFSPLSTAKSNK